jgi:hypothetical protein
LILGLFFATELNIKTLKNMSPGAQTAYLFLLAIPVACVSWTVTHEEVFREPREFFKKFTTEGHPLFIRKFFFLFTCEYCFSHYVTIALLFLTHFRLLYEGWRGYILAGFAIVWIANIYMGLYSKIRLDIKKDRMEISEKEKRSEE